MSSNDVQIFSRFFTFLNPYFLLRSLVVDRSDWSQSCLNGQKTTTQLARYTSVFPLSFFFDNRNSRFSSLFSFTPFLYNGSKRNGISFYTRRPTISRKTFGSVPNPDCIQECQGAVNFSNSTDNKHSSIPRSYSEINP